MRRWMLSGLVAWLAIGSMALAEVKLPAIISDNMVVQRGRTDVPIWGWADPGERVRVQLGDQGTTGVTNDKGEWFVTADLPQGKGPFNLTIEGKNKIIIHNVLVGEVWLCTGQSNMEFQLRNTKDAPKEIASADYPEIRLFMVQHATAATPQTQCKGAWVVCTPQTAGSFSAVGYFFGREVHQQEKVPVGLIGSYWGGTPAEAWTSIEGLKSKEELQPIVERYETALRDYPTAKAKYDAALKEWKESVYRKDPGNKGVDQGWAKADFDATDWPKMDLPGFWEETAGDFDGAVWFRREVQLPDDWENRDLRLSLGPIQDFDVAYFNGQEVGAMDPTTAQPERVSRDYRVRAELVKAGRNVIAIRVFNRAGSGGFRAKPAEMILVRSGEPAASVPLAGEWRYKIEVKLAAATSQELRAMPRPPMGPESPTSPTTLFNGMIQPLIPYAFRGAIWYQGESNAPRAEQYRTLLPTMIADWRKRWGQKEMPFGIVQLANYRVRKEEPGESDWAELREAQTMTAKQPGNGMAVIIDIGDANNIHPTNKQDVGHRLALWALATVYGKSIEYSGPTYESMAVEGDKIRLKFSHIGGGLVAKGEKLTGFAIAGEDKKFVWADAKIDGDSIVVSSAEVKSPVAVRYAWANNPECNLYNKADLPAGPFRTDAWEGMTAGKR